MERAVAIGGTNSKGYPLEHEAVRLACSPHPRALFIPTAANDNPKYVSWFDDFFGKKFGCQTDVLLLAHNTPPYSSAADAIRRAEIIYLGAGGDPRVAYEQIWPRFSISQLLQEALPTTVLAGSSAGAMFLGTKGYGQNGDSGYLVEGLGAIPGIVCAHYANPSRPSRETGLRLQMQDGDLAFALKEDTALIRQGSGLRVMTAALSGGAFLLSSRGLSISSSQLHPSASLTPITNLGNNSKSPTTRG